MEPTEIEVFRVGGKASRGITPEIIAEVAQFDCGERGVPFCFGHPKDDTPAAGVFSKFRADGEKLFGTIASITNDAIEGIKSGAWIDRSMAFFDPSHEANPTPGKWAPRHVGLLGGAAPGIPGMAPLKTSLAFAADGETLIATDEPGSPVIYSTEPDPAPIIFEAKETRMNPTEKTPEQIAAETQFAADRDALAAERTAFAARVRTQFDAGNAAMINGLVTAGKLAPASVEKLKLIFSAFDPEGDELTFSATDKATPAAALATFLADTLPKTIPVDGEQLSPSGEFSADEAKNLTPAQFNAKATAYAKEHGLTFDAAVEKLVEG